MDRFFSRTPKVRGFALVLILLVLALLIFVTIGVFSGKAFAALTVEANHKNISINFFYHGSTVSVSGISEPGTDLIIKISSPEVHQTLRQKGKVGGILWMNVKSLNIENVPNFYALHSTRDIQEILSMDEMEKYGMGYKVLEASAEVKPVENKEEKSRWFGEFVKYKEHSKLYLTSTGQITLTNTDSKQKYYILTKWPYQAPPGEYTITVYAARDKKVLEKAFTEVHVGQVGIVKTLVNMAKNNAAVYGVISIIIALGAGFGVGMIFKKGGGAH